MHGVAGRSLGNSRVHPPPRQNRLRGPRVVRRASRRQRRRLRDRTARHPGHGEPFFDTSRRRERGDGAFAGTVNVSLRPEDRLRSVLGRSIELAGSVAPYTSPIEADPAELELALIDLAVNARGAMPNGGHLAVSARNAAPGELAGVAADFAVIVGIALASRLRERLDVRPKPCPPEVLADATERALARRISAPAADAEALN